MSYGSVSVCGKLQRGRPMTEKLLRRALAVYQDTVDNIDSMPLPDCEEIRKEALEGIEKVERALKRRKHGG